MSEVGVFYCGKIEGTIAQDCHAPFSVGPVGEGRDDFEGFAADYQSVDGGNKFVVTVRDVAGFVEEVEGAVRAGEEAVEANADEHGNKH